MTKLTDAEIREFVRLAERQMCEQTGRKIKFTPKFDGISPDKLRSILVDLRKLYGHVH